MLAIAYVYKLRKKGRSGYSFILTKHGKPDINRVPLDTTKQMQSYVSEVSYGPGRVHHRKYSNVSARSLLPERCKQGWKVYNELPKVSHKITIFLFILFFFIGVLFLRTHTLMVLIPRAPRP